MKRSTFLKNASLLSAAAILIPAILRATAKSNPVILIVSGWQDVNIGDIAHTPGLIGLMRKHLPKATVILWKRSRSQLVEDMLHKYYPSLQIINGKVGTDFIPDTDEVKKAFQTADFFIHGSGPSVVAADYLKSWHLQTNKPFGLFGVTIQEVNNSLKEILLPASFIFTRETASIAILQQAGLAGDHIAFAPDATFDLDIRDPQKAAAFMTANKLDHKKFICVIPRLRMTPYYKIRPDNAGWSAENIKAVDTLNNKFKELDHAKVREAMVTWVRKTGNKIVICPEMTYEVDIMDELLIDPLPGDVKPFVVKHAYWLPDEAASLYAHAHTVLSYECHSPIIAAANGTPAFYLRQPEDTIKGQMYYDLGLGDWTFEINDTTGQQISDRLMDIAKNYRAAGENIRKSLDRVAKQYDGAFAIMREKFKIL